MRRNFRHFDEEIIILNIMNVHVLCQRVMPVFSYGNERSRSLWNFRSCLVYKDNNSSEINNYLSCT